MKRRFSSLAVGLVVAIGCGDDDAAPATIATDARVDITLDPTTGALGADGVTEAYVAVTSVEILPCRDAGASLLERARGLFAIRAAHAHGATTPTLLGIPALANLAVGETLLVGSIAPPSTPFCTVRVTYGPADGDAKGMPTSKSALGRTLWVDAAGFKLTTTATRSVDIAVTSFVPGSLGRRTQLHVSRAADAALASIDADPDHIAETSALVLDRLVAATAAHTE